jgi:predicted nucleic acid-binding protein
MYSGSLVVDASVAIKWLLRESGREEAVRILKSFQQGEIDLIAPHLLVSEVSSGLSRHVRRGEIAREHAEYLFSQFLLYCPTLVHSPGVSRSALQLALVHGASPYDCLYLAWALERRCDLVTADERFFRLTAATYACIRLLTPSIV